MLSKLFRRNRTKLFAKIIEDYIEDYYNHGGKEWTGYISYEQKRVKKGKHMPLAEAVINGNEIIFYVNNIQGMMEERLRNIVLHEIAHLHGGEHKDLDKYIKKLEKYEKEEA